MHIRIRWNGPRYWIERRWSPALEFQQFALAVASLLTPCALIAFTITFWSIGAELRWTSGFFISRGLFSHWQMWMASAAVLLFLARVLGQYPGADDR